MKRFTIPIALAALLAACAAHPPAAQRPAHHASHALPNPEAAAVSETEDLMNTLAEAYVKLVLELGARDPSYVDAYYGPREWQEDAAARRRAPEELRLEAEAIRDKLETVDVSSEEELVRLRRAYLLRQLAALSSRAEMLAGKKLSFDEESQALYDAVAPHHTAADFEATLAELDALLPGSGERAARIDALRQAFVIPPAKLSAVFDAAIAECRRRTKAHIELPEKESFTVEYVTGQPWSAYNWYQGGDRSVIQVNTDLPVTLDRAVDLACHEGYPGHHVYNLSLEEALVRGRGWVEYSVYALFSPQSLIAEGTANFGIEVAFPGEERVAFDTELAKIAGLDASQVPNFAKVQKLLAKLSYAGNEAARQYLDGQIDASAAADWLERYALTSPRARAEQRVRFFDTYRAYVINYNLGQDLVREYVESRGGTADNPARRWQVFADLLASPRLPGDLKAR